MVPALATAIVLLGAAPAAPPDAPVNFITVDAEQPMSSRRVHDVARELAGLVDAGRAQ